MSKIPSLNLCLDTLLIWQFKNVSSWSAYEYVSRLDGENNEFWSFEGTLHLTIEQMYFLVHFLSSCLSAKNLH